VAPPAETKEASGEASSLFHSTPAQKVRRMRNKKRWNVLQGGATPKIQRTAKINDEQCDDIEEDSISTSFVDVEEVDDVDDDDSIDPKVAVLQIQP